VSSTSYANYTATNVGVTANGQVDVVFSNAVSGRTLRVDYVTLPAAGGTRTVQAESGGTVFDRGTESGAGAGGSCFDGVNVVNGAELMTENGALRFVVGPEALATGYDVNGNMTLRVLDGARYYLVYDAENRLTGVSGTVNASFVYNGDGQRVMANLGGPITYYIGSYYEWKSGGGTSYYYAGAIRIAMRTGAGLEFLLGDHLGSTSLTVNSAGGNPRELRYYPWGEVRYTSGTTPTDYRFTGQMEVASIGLYFYNARWYDASLARFVQADTIIPDPGDAIAYDRFAYSRNSPVRYTDPSGHCPEGDEVCWARLYELERIYGIDIDTENYGMDGVEVWRLLTLFYLETALERMVGLIGADAFASMIGGTVFRLDSNLASVGLYDPVGENNLTPGETVISLRPDFYDQDVSGYRDGWSPIIHEMWHGIDDWASTSIYHESSPIYFSTHTYATMTGVGPPCTPNCNWNDYAWEERPFEDFAQIGTLITNIAADRDAYGSVNQYPNEIRRIYTVVMFMLQWVNP
jgi:RHS repeat-associated protein